MQRLPARPDTESFLSTRTAPAKRDRWAPLRFSIIGPLLAAPPAPRALLAALQGLAARPWRHPLLDLEVHFGVSTLQRWYYAARSTADPVAALRNRLRTDVGRFPSLSPQAIEVLTVQYREHPGWTMQLHLDNLRVALAASAAPLPSYPTLRRYLLAHGMRRQRPLKRATDGALAARERLEQREVRSYEIEHVGGLWHLDFHHCSRKVLSRAGAWIKPLLLGVIDDRSRLVCHLQWYRDATTGSLVHGFAQALMKRGLPRALMTDNGAAMTAEEFTAGVWRAWPSCITPRCPIALTKTRNTNRCGRASRHDSWPCSKARRHWIWICSTVPRKRGSSRSTTAACTPRSMPRPYRVTLQGPSVARACPDSDTVFGAFRIEVSRRVRHSDATVSVAAQRVEIPTRYAALSTVQVRYARWDRSRVDLIDARSGAVLCPIRPLDKAANADRVRGRRHHPGATDAPAANAATNPAASGMAPLLGQLLAEYAATGLPPAYLPTPNEDLP